MTYDYDLLVIGAGPGGLSASKRSAKYGAKVAIVEQAEFGGTCVNRGCIPKKLMVHAADFSHCFEQAKAYGWSVESKGFDWQAFVRARDQEIERLQQVQAKSLADAGIKIIQGHARFVDAHTIQVDDRTHTADKILIAVGGQPQKPPIDGIEHVITSREIFHLPKLPQRLGIIGGGYIGAEFASVFRGWGSEVFLINNEEYILTPFDRDIQQRVQQGLQQRDIQIFCNTTVKEIKPVANGLQITLKGESNQVMTVDTLLCATGRKPNLDNLGLEQAGVELDKKTIAVDEYSRTSQPHIFAVGDCTNKLQLTPVARAEGHAFADTVFGNQPCTVDQQFVPTGIFCRPQAAGIGMTEAQAREQYGDETIQCDRIEFEPLENRLTEEHETALMKTIVHCESKKILGVHIVAPHAAEMIQGIGLAIKQGITPTDLTQMIGVHPTLAEELFG